MLSKKDLLKLKKWVCLDDDGTGLLPYTLSNILKGLTQDPIGLIDGLKTALKLT